MSRAAIAGAVFLCVLASFGVAVAEDHPTAAIELNKLGLDKRKHGDFDGAIADYTKAIEIDPRYESAYSNRGLAKSDKGDHDGAIADYTKAIEIDPRYKVAYYNRGVAKSYKGDQDGAIADYTKAIEIDPRLKEAYSNRGLAKSYKGDQDGAIDDYTKAIEIDPRFEMAYCKRGVAKWSGRDFAGATADFKKAVEIDPANDYARFFLFLTEAAGVEGMATASENFKARRAARGKPMDKGSWVETVDRFLGGDITAGELSKVADASPEKDRVGNRCESFFYSGMLAWLRGAKTTAEELLRKCIATEKTTFGEYRAANAVLAWPK